MGGVEVCFFVCRASERRRRCRVSKREPNGAFIGEELLFPREETINTTGGIKKDNVLVEKEHLDKSKKEIEVVAEMEKCKEIVLAARGILRSHFCRKGKIHRHILEK